MKSFFDKLNLRPQERRLVVIVGIVVFVVLNFLFVVPMFGEYAKTMKDMKATRMTLARYEEEIKREPRYRAQLKQLESSGQFVAQEEQASQLMRDVTTQSALSGVTVMRWDPTQRGSSGKTNAFFEEQTLGIDVNTGEKELIDFLYSLGSGNSLIRVRTMSLNPEPSHFRLQGRLTLVESFQRKAPPRAATAPTPAKAAPAPAPAKTAPASAPPKTNALSPNPASPKTGMEPKGAGKTTSPVQKK
jgi:Tfp pilus assembly protein PilO